MALDSKQKRGSAAGLGLPFRPWLAEPDGALAAADRASLLKLCSAVEPGEPVVVVSPVTLLTGRAGRVTELTGAAGRVTELTGRAAP